MWRMLRFGNVMRTCGAVREQVWRWILRVRFRDEFRGTEDLTC